MVRSIIATLIILCFVPAAFALPWNSYMYIPDRVITGTYRYADTDNQDVTGEDDGTEAVTVTFAFEPNLIVFSWDDATNEVHLQFTTSDGDSSYIAPSSVFHVEPGETHLYNITGLASVKVCLRNDGDSGKFRMAYFAR